jgi:5-methylcytosine-specific restriction endonuclease McrA
VPNINPFDLKPGLTNSKLFARDRNVCAYCGNHFHEEELTREHIIPFAQNGRDHWMNVVTACRACNHRKANRTPEQARMDLLYTPYVPSLWEDFILRNRRILADQMEFLMAHLPKRAGPLPR